MTTDIATVTGEWTRIQLRVARQLALGYSQKAAAKLENVPLRTVEYWIANNQLEDCADILAARGWERLDPKLWGNIELALDLQREVFTGERSPKDPIYLEARHWLDRAVARAVVSSDAGSKTQVNILNAPAQP